MTVQTNQLRPGDIVRVGRRRIVAAIIDPDYSTRTVRVDWMTPGGYYAGSAKYPEAEAWTIVGRDLSYGGR